MMRRAGKEGKERGQLVRNTQGHVEREMRADLCQVQMCKDKSHLLMSTAQYIVLIIRGMLFQSLPAGKYHGKLS